jgi:Ion transport protein
VHADRDGNDANLRRNCVIRMYNGLRKYVLRDDTDPHRQVSIIANAHSNLRHSFAAQYAVASHAWLHRIVESQHMANCFLLAIIVNSVMLGMDSATISPEQAHTLEIANVFFTWLFAAEFGLRLVALGVKGYFGSVANSFDALVVIISVVELLSIGGKSSVSALRSLKTFRVLKSFRVLRVLRAFKYLRALSIITEVLGDSVPAFTAIGMLISLFLVVFAIIGLHVYGEAQLDIGFPNFHTFFGSLVIVFQVGSTCNCSGALFRM